VEEDLRQFNFGLASGLRRAQQNSLADTHRNSNVTDKLRLMMMMKEGPEWAAAFFHQSPAQCAKCNSPLIYGQCTNVIYSM